MLLARVRRSASRAASTASRAASTASRAASTAAGAAGRAAPPSSGGSVVLLARSVAALEAAVAALTALGASPVACAGGAGAYAHAALSFGGGGAGGTAIELVAAPPERAWGGWAGGDGGASGSDGEGAPPLQQLALLGVRVGAGAPDAASCVDAAWEVEAARAAGGGGGAGVLVRALATALGRPRATLAPPAVWWRSSGDGAPESAPAAALLPPELPTTTLPTPAGRSPAQAAAAAAWETWANSAGAPAAYRERGPPAAPAAVHSRGEDSGSATASPRRGPPELALKELVFGVGRFGGPRLESTAAALAAAGGVRERGNLSLWRWRSEGGRDAEVSRAGASGAHASPPLPAPVRVLPSRYSALVLGRAHATTGDDDESGADALLAALRAGVPLPAAGPPLSLLVHGKRGAFAGSGQVVVLSPALAGVEVRVCALPPHRHALFYPEPRATLTDEVDALVNPDAHDARRAVPLSCTSVVGMVMRGTMVSEARRRLGLERE